MRELENVDFHSARRANFISLCTGGGGLDLGLELAIPNARGVCMVEREAFACAHLVEAMAAGLMAPAPIWSNARTFNGRPWRGLVDGVIGGIPCQPHSLAGKRRGRDDERDLWSHARRILAQSGAWFFLLENVGGMLSSGGAERVWRDLRRLGFAVEGGLFSAAEIGAPHERERLFILGLADPRCGGLGRKGHAGDDSALLASSRGLGMVDADDRRRDRRPGEKERQEVGRIVNEWPGPGALFPPRPGELDAWRELLEDRPDLEPAIRRDAFRMAGGMGGDRVDALRMLGNGVVPLQAAYAVRTLATRLAARGAPGAERLVRMIAVA